MVDLGQKKVNSRLPFFIFKRISSVKKSSRLIIGCFFNLIWKVKITSVVHIV